MTAYLGSRLYRPPLSRALGGARIGFITACCFLLIGLLVVVVQWLVGRAGASTLRMQDLPWLGLYVAGGGASGAVGGLLVPLAERRAGAALAGIVAFQPFLYAVVRIVEHVEPGPQDALARVVPWIFMSLIFGPIVGLRWIRPWYDGLAAP